MAGDADVVLVDGKVFTASRERPWAKALAVRGDRLLAVGSSAQAERWRGRGTRLVDLRGAVVVPGFIDAHAHMADSAGEREWTRLDGTRDLEDALARLRKAASPTPRGGWVVGIDWDEAKWPERRFLTREDLDRVSTDHAVVARRIDCHIGSLNSVALERAANLVGVRGFDVDASGRPTGILTEDAFAEFHLRFEAGEVAIEQGLPAMARMAHRLGITSIHDVVGRAGSRAHQRAQRAGRSRVRVYAMPRDSLLNALVDGGLRTGFGDPWLRLGPIKIFADGSLGAYTAALAAPYAGRPGEKGMLIHSPTELRSILMTAHEAGFQTATHAIGDAAIRLVVDTLEDVQDSAPRKDARHRIEHYELPDADVLQRTKAAGIVASCQPNFIGQWSGPGDVYETRLGGERSAANNPFRKILRAGIPMCFGSDGMPYGPLFGIHWAVNGFFPDQRISPEDAIRASTAGGANASFSESETGTLEAGKLADFVVLRGDPFDTPERIAQLRIGSTWIGGERAYAGSPKS
jgi:predicted amidohydrolase YtcJ